MDGVLVTVQVYQTSAGIRPFENWLSSLQPAVREIVDARLIRVRRGLFGDAKFLGRGIWELRIDHGPGLRIYFGRDGQTLVILLNAGQKKGQSGDIESARKFWADYLKRKMP